MLFFSSIVLFADDRQDDHQNSDTLSPKDRTFEAYDEFSQKDTVFSTEFEMAKSPTGAIWRSLVLPGWGQIYVESYWKAPIFTGATAFFVYRIAYFHSNFTEYGGKVEALESRLERLKEEDPSNPEINELEYRIIPVEKNRREYYRDNRDMSAFYLLGVYALAAVDAYVGAHLFDFDVSDKGISYRFFPNKYIAGINLQMQIRFSLKDMIP